MAKAAAAVPGSFNADEKAAERAKRAIIVGGQTFHPRKKTMAMMAEWNEVAPTPEQANDPERDPMENFRDVYRQLAVFLVNGDGQIPDLEFLFAELDVEEAVELLVSLQPSMGVEQERARDLEGEAA